MKFQSQYNGVFPSVSSYLLFCQVENIPPLFYGEEMYKKMLKAGMLLPGIQCVRTLYNQGGEDGAYEIVNEGRLKGMDLNYHSGKKGIHDPEDILNEEASPDG